MPFSFCIVIVEAKWWVDFNNLLYIFSGVCCKGVESERPRHRKECREGVKSVCVGGGHTWYKQIRRYYTEQGRVGNFNLNDRDQEEIGCHVEKAFRSYLNRNLDNWHCSKPWHSGLITIASRLEIDCFLSQILIQRSPGGTPRFLHDRRRDGDVLVLGDFSKFGGFLLISWKVSKITEDPQRTRVSPAFILTHCCKGGKSQTTNVFVFIWERSSEQCLAALCPLHRYFRWLRNTEKLT